MKCQCFESIDEANDSKNSREDSQQTVHSVKEGTNPCEELQPQKEVSSPQSGDEENMEESRGAVKKEVSEHEAEETEGSVSKSVPNKDTIKKAIKKRASYFKANSAYVTSLYIVQCIYYL